MTGGAGARTQERLRGRAPVSWVGARSQSIGTKVSPGPNIQPEVPAVGNSLSETLINRAKKKHVV
eukprot:4045785-Alexandrium_andersonii.AAC.1